MQQPEEVCAVSLINPFVRPRWPKRPKLVWFDCGNPITYCWKITSSSHAQSKKRCRNNGVTTCGWHVWRENADNCKKSRQRQPSGPYRTMLLLKRAAAVTISLTNSTTVPPDLQAKSAELPCRAPAVRARANPGPRGILDTNARYRKNDGIAPCIASVTLGEKDPKCKKFRRQGAGSARPSLHCRSRTRLRRRITSMGSTSTFGLFRGLTAQELRQRRPQLPRRMVAPDCITHGSRSAGQALVMDRPRHRRANTILRGSVRAQENAEAGRRRRRPY